MARTASRFVKILYVGALAGLAGGVAEILWISMYGTVAGMPIGSVAQEVTKSILPALGDSSWSVGLGIMAHLVLAVALGFVLALALRLFVRDNGSAYSDLAVVFALAGVWAVNFFVTLPHINPEFVNLLPYNVTLLSKLFFGLSAVAVFRFDRMRMATNRLKR
jgi:hypothetical protein